mmetsp:Transcript_52700/g.59811  ORF Transcript_52700/g.59811 Transcript_52700/m.59811 type:complete len:368 (-) Transcript_52700:244-1347(-)
MRLLLPLPFMIVSTSSVSVTAFHTTATGSMRPTTRKAGRRKTESSSASRRYSTIPGFYDYAGTSSSAVSNEEQENADTYLEFLDQRYNRVHNDESNGWLRRASTPFGKKKKKTEQQPGKATNNDNENTSSSSSSVFSFCAMDWLMNTGGKHTSTPTSTSHGNEHTNGNTNTMSTSIYDDIVASCTTSRYQRQQQQEAEDDALYILGVAGLASHKLLQKHHLLTTTTTSSKAVADINAKKTFLHLETKDSDDDGRESENTNNEETLQTKEMAMRTAISLTQSYVVKKMIVPFLRVLFFIEGRKQAVKRTIQQRVLETALKPTTKLIVATVVNYYHSWQRYIHRTVAYGSVVLAIIAYNKNTILTSLQS